MATILIVDDRSTNREFLVTLLGYGGHRLLEAADGAEGLALTRAERPDLVIADILMPTMDGYEFVRQLRADPTVAGTRVIFYTAHYHEPEARKLATACGVRDILTKPCEPEEVLRVVAAALGGSRDAPPAPPPDEPAFDREHLTVLTDKLSEKVNELGRTNERLTALVELGLRLGSERDQARLLQVFCDSAREIVGARYAVVGIPGGGDAPYRHFLTSGMDLATAARVGRLGPLAGVLGSVLASGRCFRAANHGRLEAAGVPPALPSAAALLAAPILSPARVHGWVCLLDKLGGDEFNEQDEQLARMLGAQVGRIYENGSLYADLLKHSTKLAEEVAERKRAEAEANASAELFRGAFEDTGVAMVLTDLNNRFIRVNPAFARMFGYTVPEMLGMALADVTHPSDLNRSYANRETLLAGEGHFFQMEKKYLHRDGSTFWGITNVSLVRDADGHPRLYVGQIQDVTQRKRAEEEVRRATELLQAVAAGTTDAVFVKDRAGKYLLFNEAAARFVGKPVAEVLGKDDTELFDPEGARLVMDRDRRVMAAGVTETDEEQLTAAGVTRTYLATKGPYRDSEGSVAGVIGISHDITDRKRAEAQLRDRERMLAVVTGSARVGLVVVSASYEYLFANEAYADLFGLDPAGIVGRRVPDLLSHGWSQIRPRLDRALAGEPVTYELVLPPRAGDPDSRHFRAYYEPRPAGSAARAVVVVVTEVTDLKRTEEVIRKTKQRLQHVLASSPAVLFTLATESEQIRGVSWISENVREVLGFSTEEALDPNWWLDNIHPEDRERVVARSRADLFGGGQAAHEYRFRHRDGTYRWMRGDIRLVRDPGGRPVEAVGSWSDITHLRQVEDQFRQAQKMEAVGRLAGGVAHDFNNLLTVINGFGEVVLGALPEGDPSRELLREVVNAGARAAGLTRQLLAFSRKSIIEPRELDLNSIVTDVEKMLRRIIGEDVQLAISTGPEIGTILADAGQVEQVLLNLVVNARDAMPTGGRVTIGVDNVELDEAYARDRPDARAGRYAVLVVTDTGCGMSAETMARVFEPFFSTKGEHGTGLGLATVHGIVKQCGGHVAIDSAVGVGSTFRVYFPRIESRPVGAGAPGARPAVPRGSETILLAEDEDAVRALAGLFLRESGYVVLDARDGVEAERLAAEHPGRIDLLVTDVVMPRVSGRQLAARLLGRRPGLKVLFLSGYTDDAVVRHGILEAEVAFLQKPFTRAALAQKVRDVLGRQ